MLFCFIPDCEGKISGKTRHAIFRPALIGEKYQHAVALLCSPPLVQIKSGNEFWSIIETDIGRARDHVLALDVYAPDGRRLDVYSGAHLAKGRTLELTVPLVLSDPAGRWTVRVRDILTGVSATRTIKVR